MIGDVTSGTRNLPAAVKYGDATVPELGMLRHQEADSLVAWAIPGGPPGICVTPPWNKQQAKDQTQARRLYDLAIGLAGSDESPRRATGTAASTRPVSATSTATS
jgi:hypothetical protein